MKLSPETWNNILNALSIFVLMFLGKAGAKVARKSTDQMVTTTENQTDLIIERLDAMDNRMNEQDKKINLITKAVK